MRDKEHTTKSAPKPKLGRFAASLCAMLATFALAATPALAKPIHVFKASFGSPGAGAGQLSLLASNQDWYPGSGLAVNQETGDVYVADTGNHRVDQFSSSGAFIRAWGWGVADGKAELETCAVACRAGISGSGAGQFKNPVFVAVDNSGGASQGDVYVADTEVAIDRNEVEGTDLVQKFGESGSLISSWGEGGQLNGSNATGPITGPFGLLAGIAVDSSGDLWVYNGARPPSPFGSARMFEFASGGSFTTAWTGPGRWNTGIAVDSAGDLYLVSGAGVEEFHPSGIKIGRVENGLMHNVDVSGLAVDPATGDLYVDNGNGSIASAGGTEVSHFPPSSCEPAVAECTPADIFGTAEEPEGGRLDGFAQGLAIGPGHTVYAANAGTSTIVVYKQVAVPDVITGPASELTQATATLQGEVKPDGFEVTECFFEYGETTQYGQKAACETEDGEPIGSGSSFVKVHADLTGLASAFYHFRLVAKNDEARPEHGADHTFGASVDATTIKSVAFTEAALGGEINPRGLGTTCQLQYVDDATFQVSAYAQATSVPCEPAELGSGSEDVGVTAALSGLSEGTVYHFRFLAINSDHTTDGPAKLLYTYSKAPASTSCENEVLREENTSLALPDCRAYEQVSPPGNAEVFAPTGTNGGETGFEASERPMQSSPDGNTVTYVGKPSSSGEGEGAGAGSPNGDQHLATRGEDGWASRDITPLGRGGGLSRYEAFTEDLSLGIFGLEEREPPLAPEVTTECDSLYYHPTATTAEFHPFITSGPCGKPFFVGSSADGSSLLFESMAALAPGAKAGSDPEGPQEGHDNLYDSSAGQLHLVNVLPGPSPTPDPDATAGSLVAGYNLNGGQQQPPVDVSDAVSANGTRVFWTDLGTGIVYFRQNPDQAQSKFTSGKCSQPTKACTVQVSAGKAQYWTATPDGRYAYYTENGELWRFDTETEAREALAGPGSGVQGIVGVNEAGEDGSYLYFVAQGDLAPGAETRKCEAASNAGTAQEKAEATEEAEGKAPPGRGCNLYLLHGATTTFVATLLPGDDEFEVTGVEQSLGRNAHGDWAPILGFRAAQLTPDGSHLVFMSEHRLTAYDNLNVEGECGPGGVGSRHSCAEVYLYEAGGQVSCISCTPTGVPPQFKAGERAAAKGVGTKLPFAPGSLTHTPRLISADGARVFFDTAKSLVPSDENGKQDVYEWERAGAGSCAHGSPFNGGGCLSLLSGAPSPESSSLIETEAEGANVFFVTLAQHSPTDRDGKPDLYDARVNGGFPAPTEQIPCESGEACHEKGAGPGPEHSPGTSTFSGPGNPPPSTKCKKGTIKKRGKCVSKKHHKSRKHHKQRQRAGRNHGGHR